MTPAFSANSILDRWARLLVQVVKSDEDVEALAGWASRVHMSVGALREACRAAGVGAKHSLDLARVLRAVVQLQGGPWTPEAVLNCRDPRTLRALLSRTGCANAAGPPTLDELLASQSVLPRGGCHLFALQHALVGISGRTSGDSWVDSDLPSKEASVEP